MATHTFFEELKTEINTIYAARRITSSLEKNCTTRRYVGLAQKSIASLALYKALHNYHFNIKTYVILSSFIRI